MPKGVEHYARFASTAERPSVIHSLMPKGVEHVMLCV